MFISLHLPLSVFISLQSFEDLEKLPTNVFGRTDRVTLSPRYTPSVREKLYRNVDGGHTEENMHADVTPPATLS